MLNINGILLATIMKKKIIFISSLNYDLRLFDKFNLKNYIESDKINTELWKLDFKKKTDEFEEV